MSAMDEVMTYRDVARWTGMTQVNLRNRLVHGRMPAPDGRVGEKPYWMEITIRRWAPHGHPDKHMRADAGGPRLGAS